MQMDKPAHRSSDAIQDCHAAENSRRSFLKTAASAVVIAGSDFLRLPGESSVAGIGSSTEIPWYQRATRWGQTNITEMDPAHYDIEWWRNYWKITHLQGVIINAGGIVAYYPSKVPLHRQAKYLAGRDLFGDLCQAAHEDGLAVFARMDSNRAHEEFYIAHPDWFTRDAEGKPYKAGELYVTCVNSPYYNEHIPSILTEIAKLYRPEGFTDNSWSGLGRDSICYCAHCMKSFREKTGNEIPRAHDWNSAVYREWIQWNYRRRLEIWEMNNRISRAAGGPACIWSGMNSGSVSQQSESFRDLKEICQRADILMLDSQARNDSGGFQQNADTGKLVHGLLGWNKLVPESMAMYQAGRPTFRLSGKPVPEARLWMLEGIAGGIQPWWHFVGASHEDRRIYHTPVPVFAWHKSNEEYLINREPIANVGVVWSQQNMDFYGRSESAFRVELPWRGITQALLRSRIPYVPVHADHIDRDAGQLSLLVLPDLAVLTDAQAAGIKRFVERGGGLMATGKSSLYDDWGDRRSDYALGDLFGVHATESSGAGTGNQAGETFHTYLRLYPELRKYADGPKTGLEPALHGVRHPVFKGFNETDILSFGGNLEAVKTDPGTEVLLTFIPAFPIYPPETAWMRQPVTDIPGLILNTTAGGSRITFLPADLDRQFGRYNLPDHGNLLANLIRWTAKDNIPILVECAGMIDCNIYQQKKCMILHLVNLTNPAAWRQPMEDYLPVGPVKIRIRLQGNLNGKYIRLLVEDQMISHAVENGWIQFTINSISDHEVVVIT
jgi:hypothetical protein